MSWKVVDETVVLINAEGRGYLNVGERYKIIDISRCGTFYILKRISDSYTTSAKEDMFVSEREYRKIVIDGILK